jgi:hypothetical protein
MAKHGISWAPHYIFQILYQVAFSVPQTKNCHAAPKEEYQKYNKNTAGP